MEEHIDHLTVFFKAVGEAGLNLKIKNCVFAMQRVNFLGHFVDNHGVRVDEEKIDATKRAPVPTNSVEMRSFYWPLRVPSSTNQGFFRNIYRPSFTNFGVQEIRMVWRDSCLRNFKREAYLSAGASLPDFESLFILETDDSNVSAGSVLAQKMEDGKIRFVQYASRTIATAERNYPACEIPSPSSSL